MYTMLHLKTVVLSFLMAFDVLFPSPAYGVRISNKAHDVILTELPLLTNVHASQSCKTLDRLSRQVFFRSFCFTAYSLVFFCSFCCTAYLRIQFKTRRRKDEPSFSVYA